MSAAIFFYIDSYSPEPIPEDYFSIGPFKLEDPFNQELAERYFGKPTDIKTLYVTKEAGKDGDPYILLPYLPESSFPPYYVYARTYSFRRASFVTVKNRILLIKISEPGLKTIKGIKIGDSGELVKKQYGQSGFSRNEPEENILEYGESSRRQLLFGVDGKKEVSLIVLRQMELYSLYSKHMLYREMQNEEANQRAEKQ